MGQERSGSIIFLIMKWYATGGTYIAPGTTRFDPPCSSSRKSPEKGCKSATPPLLKQQPRSRGGGGVTHPPSEVPIFCRLFFSDVKREFHVKITEHLQTLQQQLGRVGEGLGLPRAKLCSSRRAGKGGRGTRSNA